MVATQAVFLISDATGETAEVAGPGFLNLRLVPDVWHDVVAEVVDANRTFGHSGMGAGVRVNIEVDMLARYVVRALEAVAGKSGGLTRDLLGRAGF